MHLSAATIFPSNGQDSSPACGGRLGEVPPHIPSADDPVTEPQILYAAIAFSAVAADAYPPRAPSMKWT